MGGEQGIGDVGRAMPVPASPGMHGTGRRRRVRRWVTWSVLAATTAVALALGPAVVVRTSVASHVHHDVAQVPPTQVAIVLGAGLTAAGGPSPYLAQRIDVAVRLYRAGAVKALLMSGDRARADHDEVGVRQAEAIRLGVPASAVFTDHAGFDTYSSCYRARSVWGIRSAVVISQPFHVGRAVWLCRRLGVAAEGAATISSYPQETRAGWAREVPATAKSVLDVVTGREPRFPGPREHGLDAFTRA